MGRPRGKNPARQPAKQGRKKLPDTHRKAMARRFRSVMLTDFGNPNQMEQRLGAIGKTAQGWLSPERESAVGAWANLATPDLPSVVKFARLTQRRVAWLVDGEEPEFAGESMPRADLAVAFTNRAETAVAEDMGVPLGTTVQAARSDAVLAHALQLLVDEQRRIREQVAPLRRISEVAHMLKAIATQRDDFAASDLGESLRARLEDAVSVRSPVEFYVNGPYERIPLQDKGEAIAWRKFLARQGLPDDFSSQDVELWHYGPLMGATGTIRSVPIPERSAKKQNRPASERRTGGKQRQR